MVPPNAQPAKVGTWVRATYNYMEDHMSHTMEDLRFLDCLRGELHSARKKFPSPDGLMAALTEEVGEVAKAMLDEKLENVWAESVSTIWASDPAKISALNPL